MCKSCDERREGRVKDWIEKPKRTIWVGEVADENNRVALIIGQFEMTKWFNGRYVDSLLTQSFHDHDATFGYGDLISDIQHYLDTQRSGIGEVRNVLKEVCVGEKTAERIKERGVKREVGKR